MIKKIEKLVKETFGYKRIGNGSDFLQFKNDNRNTLEIWISKNNISHYIMCDYDITIPLPIYFIVKLNDILKGDK